MPEGVGVWRARGLVQRYRRREFGVAEVLEQRALDPHPRELLRRLHQNIPPRGSINQERRISIAGVGAQKLTRRTRTEETRRPALQT